MSRYHLLLPVLLVLCACGREEAAEPAAESAAEEPGASPVAALDISTAEGKISSAMSAAPAAIASEATIMEMAQDGSMNQLREGSNGWVCMPDNPGTPGPDPMCVDRVWQAWFGAYLSRSTPELGEVGTAYMLAGGADASNTDPYATAPAEGEEWVMSGPHVMTLPASPDQLASYPTDPEAGGPYVMWAGTPYAHLMVPVARD